ncbi:methyltransferase-like protein 27 [Babylonia areolata]|uniref:methyltransferase-like protein 27 n=1 Tax=Babylonia areolata TaxID=304850 RepID=UPI003FD6A573
MADRKKGDNSNASKSGVFVYEGGTVFKAAERGISREASTGVYQDWASQYDADMNDEKYRGALAAHEAVVKLYPTDREKVFVLDVACGTGIVAEKLQKQGFRRMEGLDPSQKMLDEAEQKKVYEKLYCCYLDSTPLPMDPDTYDCAVIAGGMCEGHIPTSGLRSMVRVVKPGGTVVIVMREAFLWEVAEYKDRLEKEMGDMEKEGLWRLSSRTPLPNYFHQHTGVVFIFYKS